MDNSPERAGMLPQLETLSRRTSLILWLTVLDEIIIRRHGHAVLCNRANPAKRSDLGNGSKGLLDSESGRGGV
jgi:hypothetical protein